MDNAIVRTFYLLYIELKKDHASELYIPCDYKIKFNVYLGKAGWQGDDCSVVDQQVYQCLPGCSEHGTYDLETGGCVCERHWTGPDCSQGN